MKNRSETPPQWWRRVLHMILQLGIGIGTGLVLLSPESLNLIQTNLHSNPSTPLPAPMCDSCVTAWLFVLVEHGISSGSVNLVPLPLRRPGCAIHGPSTPIQTTAQR